MKSKDPVILLAYRLRLAYLQAKVDVEPRWVVVAREAIKWMKEQEEDDGK